MNVLTKYTMLVFVSHILSNFHFLWTLDIDVYSIDVCISSSALQRLKLFSYSIINYGFMNENVLCSRPLLC